MKENLHKDNVRDIEEGSVDYKELIFQYIIHWPWFVASILVCLIGSWAYLHFQTPVYQVSASIMIKDDKKSGGNSVQKRYLKKLSIIWNFIFNITMRMSSLKKNCIKLLR